MPVHGSICLVSMAREAEMDMQGWISNRIDLPMLKLHKRREREIYLGCIWTYGAARCLQLKLWALRKMRDMRGMERGQLTRASGLETKLSRASLKCPDKRLTSLSADFRDGPPRLRAKNELYRRSHRTEEGAICYACGCRGNHLALLIWATCLQTVFLFR